MCAPGQTGVGDGEGVVGEGEGVVAEGEGVVGEGEGVSTVSVGVSSPPPPEFVGDVPTTEVDVGVSVGTAVAVGVASVWVASTTVGAGEAVGSKVRKGGKEKSPFVSR